MRRLLLASRELLVVFLLVFPPLAYGAVQIGPLTLVHLAAVALGALWMLSWVKRRRLALPRTPIDLPLALFFGVAGLSAAFSVYPWASRFQLYQLLTYGAVYVVLVHSLDRRRRLMRLAWLVVLAGSALAVAGLTLGEIEVPGLETFSRGTHRLALTFVNHNHFAGYVEMAACLGVGLALAFRGARRILVLALGLFMALAVLFSLSRGGTLAMAGGLGFLLAALATRRRDRRGALWIGAFLALLLAAAAVLGGGPVIESLETLGLPLAAGRVRFELWRGAAAMIAAEPWTGTGPGTFAYAYERFQTEATARWLVDHAHNDYLEITAEMGLPGLLSGLLVLAVLLVRGWRGLHAHPDTLVRRIGLGALAGCFALAVHGAFDFNASIPANALLFVTLAALAMAAVRLEQQEPARWIDLRFGRASGWVIGPAVVLIATTAAAAAVAPYLASRHGLAAAAAREQGRVHLAAARLEEAMSLDPANADHPARLADLYTERSRGVTGDLRRARLGRALTEYGRAIEACPTCSTIRRHQALALELLGRLPEAEEALAKAARLAPMDPSCHYDLGRFYLRRGDRGRSSAAYRRLLELEEAQLPRILDELWRVQPLYAAVEPAVPRRARARRTFSRFLFDRGETRGALREAALAFSLDPTPEGALIHLRGLASRGNERAALEAGETYLWRFAGDEALRRQVVRIYRNLGRFDRAIALAGEAVAEQPGRADLYVRLGELQREAGRPEDALGTLQAGVERRGDDAGLQAALARLHAAADRPGDALQAWKRAVSLRPRATLYRYRLGEAYLRLGLPQQAVDTWRECLRIDPGDERSRRAIARVLEEMGMG